MAIFLDNLHYNGNLVTDLIVVTNNRQDYICVKTTDDSSTSYKFLVSHEESFEIGLLIFESFMINFGQLNVAPIFQNLDFERDRFSFRFDIGELGQFNDFENIDCRGIQIFFLVDNQLSLNSQFEILLCMEFSNNEIVIFDKWSVSKTKNSFANNLPQIGLQHHNFNDRREVRSKLAESAFSDFRSSIHQLNDFMVSARRFEIQRPHLLAVYLDLKNRNRSRTNLILSPENRTTIRNDLRRVGEYIQQMNDDFVFSYVDFLFIIGKQLEIRGGLNSFDFEITASRVYNSLMSKQKSFDQLPMQRRLEYEEDQYSLLYGIRDIV